MTREGFFFIAPIQSYFITASYKAENKKFCYDVSSEDAFFQRKKNIFLIGGRNSEL